MGALLASLAQHYTERYIFSTFSTGVLVMHFNLDGSRRDVCKTIAKMFQWQIFSVFLLVKVLQQIVSVGLNCSKLSVCYFLFIFAGCFECSWIKTDDILKG